MKKIATTLALVALCASSALAANPVRISQVYGGGGVTSGTPTYNVDYVEIFNNSGSPVNIGGWVLEYGSATGNWGSSTANTFTFPANTTIQPCKYILVQWGLVGSVGSALPVLPDFTMGSTFTMSGSNGKVGLFNALNANLACGAELPGTIVDKVAYGTANCSETTAAGGLSSIQMAVRNGGGTVDTDNNNLDFTVVNNAVPRNAAAPANQGCLSVPTQSNTWGSIKSMYR